MGAEPTCPCAQMEHIADLLKNRVNSKQNPSSYEVWKSKIAEDIKRWMNTSPLSYSTSDMHHIQDKVGIGKTSKHTGGKNPPKNEPLTGKTE